MKRTIQRGLLWKTSEIWATVTYSVFFVFLALLYHLWMNDFFWAWKGIAFVLCGLMIIMVLGLERLIPFAGFCLLLSGFNAILQNDEVHVAWKVLSSIVLMLQFFSLGGNSSWLKPAVVDKQRLDTLNERLQTIMVNEKVFTNPELTLSKLAQLAEVKPYILSTLLNANYKKSFSEYINEQRVNEVERRLLSYDLAKFTIEAIAYDCGFKSPSAFYSVFKKSKGISPSEFIAKKQQPGNTP